MVFNFVLEKVRNGIVSGDIAEDEVVSILVFPTNKVSTIIAKTSQSFRLLAQPLARNKD